jgi:RNA polymerase sigma factor (TIGR02999 family)
LGSEPPVTEYLRAWNRQDRDAIGVVVETLYTELHRIAGRILSAERRDHTLQPSALVNELYLRLHAGTPPEWRNRAHFLAVASNTLRRILIDHARAHRAAQRGGGEAAIALDPELGAACSYDDLLMIDEALEELERMDSRAARVTELRFFAGLLESEIAEELGVSEITVKRDWKFARAWLASRFESR